MRIDRSWIWAFILITLLLPLNFYLLFHLGLRLRTSLLIRPFLIEYALTIALGLPYYFSQRFMKRTGDRRPMYATWFFQPQARFCVNLLLASGEPCDSLPRGVAGAFFAILESN